MMADSVADGLGISVDIASSGSATVSMTVTDEMTNALGVCHGGVLFTLADTAMEYASNSAGTPAFATTATIDWVKAASVGERLTASCTVAARRGRNVIHDIVVTNEAGEMILMVRGQTLTVGGTGGPVTAPGRGDGG